MALTVLAAGWARDRGGCAQAVIVDHGLRPGSAEEAREAAARLAAHDVAAEVVALGLSPGTGVSVRARDARRAALEAACARAGMVHLLLGHHAGDQAETVVMRGMAGSGPAGRAGMAALTEAAGVRLLRPLLGVAPGRLRATLRAHGIAWSEDPSNADAAYLRARVRRYRGDPDGTSPATAATCAASTRTGRVRAAAEREAGGWLAEHATLHPAGFALLPPGPVPPAALAALLRSLAGALRPPRDGVAALARALRPATLGGVRILPAGRLGPGWLLIREARAMQPAVAAGAVWDGRFRMLGRAPEGFTLGALGADTRDLPAHSWPAALRRTLPALRHHGVLAGVPHLQYPSTVHGARVVFAPPAPVACAPFVPAAPGVPDTWRGLEGGGVL